MFGRFQLETRYFKHRPGVVAAFIHQRDDRNADVSADRGVEDFSGERSRGGFAVGAGNGDGLAFQKAEREFQLAKNGQAEAPDLHELWRVERHARAYDDEVLAAEGEQPMSSGFDRNSLFEKSGNVLAQLLGAANVRDCDLRAATAQKKGRRQTGLAQSDH